MLSVYGDLSSRSFTLRPETKLNIKKMRHCFFEDSCDVEN